MIAEIIMKNWPEYMSRNPKGLILLSLLLLFFVLFLFLQHFDE